MSFDAQQLYSLLPAIYRIRDAENGFALQALVSIIAEQAQILEENLEQLYDDQFIETCAPWVVPYIGDLIGVRSLHGTSATVGSPRAEVANTIGFRRRKGTLAVLEQLARDVTGWPARAVEFFQLLSATQYMNHIRPAKGAWVDVRNSEALQAIGTAFELVAHTADVRRIAVNRGRFNIPNIGIFLWRLESFPLTSAQASSLDAERWLFDPLGRDIQLFSRPGTLLDETALSSRANIGEPLTIHRTSGHLGAYYGAAKSILLNVDGKDVAPDLIRVCDLQDFAGSWAHLPSTAIAIDPVRGRIAFPAAQLPTSVRVTFRYGFSATIGGGEYDRATTFTNRLTPLIQTKAPAKIEDAIHLLGSGGTVEITDNSTYVETLSLAAGTHKLELRAANGQRPVVKLGAEFAISGSDGSEVTINGLVVVGAALHVTGNVTTLRIVHSTLVPDSGHPSLIVEAAGIVVEIDHSICGAIRAVDSASINLASSIVDATSEDAAAISGLDGIQAAGQLTMATSTIIGKVHSVELAQVSDSILLARLQAADAWAAPVLSDRRQQGCMRFSFVPFEAVTPRRFKCQPVSAAGASRIRPQFTSLRYGDPGYAQLSLRSATEILAGAHDGAEMGAFHDLFQPQRLSNLQLRVTEYLRFGLEAGVFFAT
jgi:hypothetical protein